MEEAHTHQVSVHRARVFVADGVMGLSSAPHPQVRLESNPSGTSKTLNPSLDEKKSFINILCVDLNMNSIVSFF